MADLSQIPTDQLMQMLQQHPDATAPINGSTSSPPQTSFGLGLYQGAMHVLDNAATAAKYVANKIPVPGANEGLGDAIDNVGQRLGLPSDPQAVQGHVDYIASRAKQGVVPSTPGRIVGEIGATLPAAVLPGGILAQGAAAGALTTNANDPVGIAKDALLGAVAGKAAHYGLGILARALPSAANAVVPTTDALRDAASAAYSNADKSGMIISGSSLRNLSQNIENDLASQGADANLHPNAIASYNRVLGAATDPKTGGNVTLQGLDTLRKVAGNGVKASVTNPGDAYMSGIIQNHIDDFLDDLKPSDVVGGVPDQKSMDALTNARSLWATAKKSDIIDAAMDKAQNSASNLTQGGAENAQRTAFRSIANNPKVFNRFNPDEQAAILNVVRGGPITNALRNIGKLAPRGVVSAGADMMLGSATGLGGLPLMLVGEAARRGSSVATNRTAQALSELVRNGGTPVAQVPSYAAKILTLAKTPSRIAAPTFAINATSNSQ